MVKGAQGLRGGVGKAGQVGSTSCASCYLVGQMVPKRDTHPAHKMSWRQGCWRMPTGAGVPGRFLTIPPSPSFSCTFLISGMVKDLDTRVTGITVPKSALCGLYRLLAGSGCLGKDRELKIPILGCRSLSLSVSLFKKFNKVSLPRNKIK